MQEIFDLWLVIKINKQSNRCKSDKRKALDKSQQTQERTKMIGKDKSHRNRICLAKRNLLEES